MKKIIVNLCIAIIINSLSAQVMKDLAASYEVS
jgi:hypothetical protein